MKISEMIKNLQEFMDEHGDIDCWYTEYEEDKVFYPINCEPGLFYVYKDDDDAVCDFNEIYWEGYHIDDYMPICVVN